MQENQNNLCINIKIIFIQKEVIVKDNGNLNL